MVTILGTSPFYAVYAPQAEAVNAAVEQAAQHSAAQMGAQFACVYSISTQHTQEKLAA